MKPDRLLLIGLDSAVPRFVFGPNAPALPCLQGLAARGCHGLLRSCDPPITVPAWGCMMSSKDPGTLGIYGFRNRTAHAYDGERIATSRDVREKRIWEILADAGLRIAVVGVPLTYPPPKLPGGRVIADFLVPDASAEFTHPPELKQELQRAIGDYQFDVENFRSESPQVLLDRLHALLKNRFAAARYLARSGPWDFLMMVDMGIDRVQHAFWKYCDPAHPAHVAGNPLANSVADFYRAADSEAGELIAACPPGTAVMVVSDHGARAMHGGVCINQWLINEGLLVMKDITDGVAPFDPGIVDWSRTKVWASGGYYARVFLNIAGREPRGIVAPSEVGDLLVNLTRRIESMLGPDGLPLENRVLRPASIYTQLNGSPPDLMIYFGDLAWRAIGGVGYGTTIFVTENDTGPDGSNHDMDGIFILDAPGTPRGELEGLTLYDVAPTVLGHFGLPVPEDMIGTSVLKRGAG